MIKVEFFELKILFILSFDGNLTLFDTSNINTFNVLDKNVKVRVHNDIGPILSYSINTFETAIFIFYLIDSRPGSHIFCTTEIENDFTEI